MRIKTCILALAMGSLTAACQPAIFPSAPLSAASRSCPAIELLHEKPTDRPFRETVTFTLDKASYKPSKLHNIHTRLAKMGCRAGVDAIYISPAPRPSRVVRRDGSVSYQPGLPNAVVAVGIVYDKSAPPLVKAPAQDGEFPYLAEYTCSAHHVLKQATVRVVGPGATNDAMQVETQSNETLRLPSDCLARL